MSGLVLFKTKLKHCVLKKKDMKVKILIATKGLLFCLDIKYKYHVNHLL